jgi:hypothetical protein
MIEPAIAPGSIVTKPYANSSEFTYFDILGFIRASAKSNRTYFKSS